MCKLPMKTQTCTETKKQISYKSNIFVAWEGFIVHPGKSSWRAAEAWQGSHTRVPQRKHNILNPLGIFSILLYFDFCNQTSSKRPFSSGAFSLESRGLLANSSRLTTALISPIRANRANIPNCKRVPSNENGWLIIFSLPNSSLTFTIISFNPSLYFDGVHSRTYNGPLTFLQSLHSPWLIRTCTCVIGAVENAKILNYKKSIIWLENFEGFLTECALILE